MTRLLTWLSRLFWPPRNGRWTELQQRRVEIGMMAANKGSALE